MSQKGVIVGMLKKDATFELMVPGSIEETCNKCGQLVWLSPASVEIKRLNVDWDVTCMECVIKEIRAAKNN